MTSASDKRADDEMRRLWKEFHAFYTGHFRAPDIGLSMADQMAFFEIAQPIMRSLAQVKAPREKDTTKAHARTENPSTSHEAAAKVTPTLRELQHTVLGLFVSYGAMTDLELSKHSPKGTAYSTYRTRRAELVTLGLLRDSGRKAYQDGHLRQDSARLSVDHVKSGKAGLIVEPGEVLREIARRLSGAAQASRPRAFLAWAVEMFGPVAKMRSERLLRFIEEAIELAHAEGMERAVLNKVADRVYSRPAGIVSREIGQAQACLETFAENIGRSSADEAEREWQRVQSIPQEEWMRRHAAKQELGIALPSADGVTDHDGT